MIPPPIAVHKTNKDIYASSWACLRETLVLGEVPRYLKEAVAAGASEANKCPYCIGAHSMMLDVYKPGKSLEASQETSFHGMNGAELQNWARACFLPADRRPKQPFPKTFQSEIVGTAVFFHYLTRIVTIYLGDSLIPKKLNWLVPLMMPLMRIVMGLNDRRSKTPGASQLKNIPRTGGPEWADKDNVRLAFAQFQNVLGDNIRKVIDIAVIDFINSFLSSWESGTESLSKNWVNPHIDVWSEQETLRKQQARFIILTIGSPYMIVEEDKDVLIKKMGYSNLFTMTAWASLKAALKTGQLIVSQE
jgi:AhpD family alkylhydroperoxidase